MVSTNSGSWDESSPGVKKPSVTKMPKVTTPLKPAQKRRYDGRMFGCVRAGHDRPGHGRIRRKEEQRERDRGRLNKMRSANKKKGGTERSGYR